MRLFCRTLTVAAMAVAAGAPLRAQSLETVRTTSFGVAGGAAFPIGNGTDGLNTGYVVSGSVGFRPVNAQVGFRVEAMYTRFAADGFNTFSVGGDFSIVGGLANAVLTVPTSSGVHPYLTGGAGLYHAWLSGTSSIVVNSELSGTARSVDGFDSQTRFGLNGGVGLEFAFSGFSSFVEVRYHSIFTDGATTNFVPLTFGLRF